VAWQQRDSSLGIPGVSIARDTEFGMAFVAFVFLYHFYCLCRGSVLEIVFWACDSDSIYCFSVVVDSFHSVSDPGWKKTWFYEIFATRYSLLYLRNNPGLRVV
jgi:hypothetical protein